MEYVKLLIVFCLLSAAATAGLVIRRSRRWRLLLTSATAFSVFLGESTLLFSPFFDSTLRAPNGGLTLRIVDVFAVALLFASQATGHPLAFRKARWSYVAFIALTLAWCQSVAFGLFGLWTVMRALLLFVALSRALADPRAVFRVLNGWAAGLVWIAVVCLRQRYLEGGFQVTGPYGHQNMMATCVLLTAPTLLATLLASRYRHLLVAGLLGGAAAVVMSLSRAALALLPVTLVVTFLTSVTFRMSGRKLVYAGAGGLIAIAGAIKAIDSILARFGSNVTVRSNESRWLYERMTNAMISDHPFGVGYNQFAGEVDSYRRLLHPDETWVERGALVHNIYLMTVAELGYFGTALFLLLWLLPLLYGLRNMIRLRGDLRADIILGCCGGLAACYLQGTLEWATRTDLVSYVYWSVWAVIGALPRHTPAQVQEYGL